MSINANNDALNEILETINNLPSADGSSGGTVYTNIVYNDDNTVTLTDKDGVDHTMVYEYTDGVLSGLTYDGKSVELTYEEDTLVNIGAIEVDMANVPYESGGGGAGLILSDFTGKDNKPKIADLRSFWPDKPNDLNYDGIFVYKFFNNGFYTDLHTVYLPDWITCFSGNMFNGCSNLTNLYGDTSNVTLVGGSAFSGCVKLTEFPYMPKLKQTQNSAFGGCKGLTEIKIYNTLNSFTSNTFNNCTNITDIYVPWAEGTNVGGDAPWGATNATIHYNTTYDADGNPECPCHPSMEV